MKKLLYLKDHQLKEYIEKIFNGYRETVADAKKVLDCLLYTSDAADE